MNNYLGIGPDGVRDVCARMREAGVAAGFTVQLTDPRGNGHAFGTRVRARLVQGGNSTTITYDVVYCPIQDRVYLDSRREQDLCMTDLPTFDAFVKKSKAIDEVIEKLLPEKPIIFSFGTPDVKTTDKTK
jgi:hypothetical protein